MSKVTIQHNIVLSFGTNKGSGADSLGKGPAAPVRHQMTDAKTITKQIVLTNTPYDQLSFHDQNYNHHLTIQPDPKLKLDVYDINVMKKSFIKFIQANHTLTNSLSANLELGKGLKPHLHIIFSATNINANQLKTQAKKLYSASTKNNIAAFLQPITDKSDKLPCHTQWCGEANEILPNKTKYGETGYPYLQKEPQNRQKLLLHKKYSRIFKKRPTKKEKEEGQKLLNKEYPV